jgi:anti-sigma B factor antagonist
MAQAARNPSAIAGLVMANATIEVEQLAGGVTKVRLKGRLDVAGAAEVDLRFNTIAGAQRAVIVDLSMVDFLASMGIRTLITGAKAIRGKQGKMVALSPEGHVEKVLVTTGTNLLIPIHHDEQAAIAAVTH